MAATAASSLCVRLFIIGLLGMCAVNSAPAAGRHENRAVIEPYRGKYRVLVVFAPSRQDVHCKEQSELLVTETAGLNERDVILIFALADGKGWRVGTHLFSGGDEHALRRRYGVGPRQFRVILIGKDGHEAYSSRQPISSARLFGLIDAMPMRRAEMRRQQRP
jgi:hypothetical protein